MVFDHVGGHAGEGIVAAHGFAEFLGIGHDEKGGYVEDICREPQCPPEVMAGGGDHKIVVIEAEGEDAELPGLAAGDERKCFIIKAFGFRIDGAGEVGVLFSPTVFDLAGIDEEEGFADQAEGLVGGFLGGEGGGELFIGQKSLIDKDLSEGGDGDWVHIGVHAGFPPYAS